MSLSFTRDNPEEFAARRKTAGPDVIDTNAQGDQVVEEMQRKLVQRQQRLEGGVRAGLTAAQRRVYARYTDLQVNRK